MYSVGWRSFSSTFDPEHNHQRSNLGNSRRWIRNGIIYLTVACSGMHRRGNVSNAVHAQPWCVTCNVATNLWPSGNEVRRVLSACPAHAITPRCTYKVTSYYIFCDLDFVVLKVLRAILLLADIPSKGYGNGRSAINRQFSRSREECQ